MANREEIDKVLILATGRMGADLDKVKRDLSDLGVVIKDNRDPADCESCPVAVVCGYVAVEPLILEV